MPEECVLNWTFLKSLTLTYLFLGDEQIASSCPQLESLELQEFCGFHRLHITSPKCRRLQLIDYKHPDKGWGSLGRDCSFEIVAPYVQHIKFSGILIMRKLSLGTFRLWSMLILLSLSMLYMTKPYNISWQYTLCLMS
ncbi:hypothetical protein A4A49_11593 [Nicotiana attenuata]|uniref:Uncharacterized protein n=1 Tax=Nicotiana attenuata TaxID=49451 RepID=A0A1J6IP04_NICAT|nr:hypothetical protein A4A49_11593 [Nicotiana attenuata]